MYCRTALQYLDILDLSYTLLDIFFPLSNGPCGSYLSYKMGCTWATYYYAYKFFFLQFFSHVKWTMWSPTYLTRWDAHVGSPHCWGLQGPCVITVIPTLLSLLSVNKMVNHSAEEEPVYLQSQLIAL